MVKIFHWREREFEVKEYPSVLHFGKIYDHFLEKCVFTLLFTLMLCSLSGTHTHKRTHTHSQQHTETIFWPLSLSFTFCNCAYLPLRLSSSLISTLSFPLLLSLSLSLSLSLFVTIFLSSLFSLLSSLFSLFLFLSFFPLLVFLFHLVSKNSCSSSNKYATRWK